MKLRYKILSGAVGLLAIGVGVLMFQMSRTHPCPEPAIPSLAGATMSAITHRCYGGPESLQLEIVPRPVPAADQVLVRVQAASINPLEYYSMRGEPRFMRLDSGFGAPEDIRFGTDFAGVVDAVGAGVTRFKPGDAVFGAASGALGEYALVRESRAIALKPANVSFEEAAAMPVAAITALEALRDKAQVKAGQKVLINGASGGVGTYAVQIAKALGAEVTGVSSGRNVELVRSLGADSVIDYTQENFTTREAQYDVIIDNVGNHSLSDTRRALKPDGVLVIIGGPKGGVWLGPLTRFVAAAAMDPFVSQRLEGLLAGLDQAGLESLAQLMVEGKLRSSIDKRYPLAETAEAVRYVETGRARGKVIVSVSPVDASPVSAAPSSP
jgi:NADPH:quinone reductase-like Zn-dependent oxidoreductase